MHCNFNHIYIIYEAQISINRSMAYFRIFDLEESMYFKLLNCTKYTSQTCTNEKRSDYAFHDFISLFWPLWFTTGSTFHSLYFWSLNIRTLRWLRWLWRPEVGVLCSEVSAELWLGSGVTGLLHVTEPEVHWRGFSCPRAAGPNENYLRTNKS